MFNLVGRRDVSIALAHNIGSRTAGVLSGATREERFLARESTLALGSMGRFHDAPAVRAVARQTIAAVLSAGGDNALALRPALAAIGNMGDATLLPLVEKYARHAKRRVRMAATYAIRGLRPRDSAPLVSAWLARERHHDVKRKLYLALQRATHDARPHRACSRRRDTI